MNAYISLEDFKHSIQQQAESLAEYQLPGEYDPKFDLNKALRLYYGAYQLSRTAPTSVFIKTVNHAITDTIAFEGEEADADFVRTKNFISDQIYHLTFISNFIALAMED
ncbi:hypothetical protein ABDK00_013260 [Niabella insulamsoli]|uniref:hypothetical protein n=1 Tax=Niabella insulamsoli TaxID=3144874 RepID=UPI0031FBDCF9